jgi:hypothetical protein
MNTSKLSGLVLRCFAVAIVAVGFAPWANAGIIGSSEFLDTAARAEQIADIEIFLARADVAEQLKSFGVSPDMVLERVDSLTDQELLELQGAISEQVAGGDVIAVLGIIFVVLLVLELLGVTNVFSAF